MSDRLQEIHDAFYHGRGRCCAGCDHWRGINSAVGECRKGPPVSAAERWAMLGMDNVSAKPVPGHIVTRRDHDCDAFADTFPWETLPLPYLKRVGYRKHG